LPGASTSKEQCRSATRAQRPGHVFPNTAQLFFEGLLAIGFPPLVLSQLIDRCQGMAAKPQYGVEDLRHFRRLASFYAV
jgi:hypothetical protein